MKLGIIGSGLIVQAFLPRLVKMEGLQVQAVQGTPETREQVEQLCAENGVPHACSSFEQLCGLDIDTVYVAVPNFLHADYCRRALEKGLNVIVEKPMASNAREAEELAALAQKNGRFLFEAVTTPYLENFAKIREWLPKIGTVKMVQSQYSQYSRRYDAFRAGQVLPVFDPAKSGGAMMDLNLYNLHLVMGLFGEPERVWYSANVERGIDTSGVLLMQYQGFQALCLAAKDSKGATGAVIQGTDGCIRTAGSPNFIGTVTLELNDGTVRAFNEGTPQERLLPEFRAFIRCVNENDHAFCDRMMACSIAVSRTQTEARLQAGVRFPADEVEQK